MNVTWTKCHNPVTKFCTFIVRLRQLYEPISDSSISWWTCLQLLYNLNSKWPCKYHKVSMRLNFSLTKKPHPSSFGLFPCELARHAQFELSNSNIVNCSEIPRPQQTCIAKCLGPSKEGSYREKHRHFLKDAWCKTQGNQCWPSAHLYKLQRSSIASQVDRETLSLNFSRHQCVRITDTTQQRGRTRAGFRVHKGVLPSKN